jgi:HSP20 family molecular chaperone IbpA
MNIKLTAFVLTVAAGTAMAATEDQLSKQFNVQPEGRVVVDVDFGAIAVTSAEGNHVKVDAWRKVTRKNKAAELAFLKEHPIDVTQDGNTITIRSRGPNKNESNFFSNNKQEARYVISVPAKFNTDLTTSGGYIKISQITGTNHAQTSGGTLEFDKLIGTLDGHTSGGYISAKDCEGTIAIRTSGGSISVTGGGGTLKGNTAGGRVEVKDFKGPASVSTSGGSITVEKVAGKIEASTSGGSINATLLSPLPGDIRLNTSGGSITIQAPGDVAMELDLDTSAGRVSSDLPVVIEGKKEANHLHGPVNGGGHKVAAHTSGGSIHVEKM